MHEEKAMSKTDRFTDQAKKMGEDVKKLGRNVWLAGLGAVSIAEEEARDAFQRLVDRGEKVEKDEENPVLRGFDRAGDQVKDFGHKVEDTVQNTVNSVLHRAGVPSREEIRTLTERVEELSRKLENLRTS
jgi:poly(hydroxyalkanoate) granule-associated protein